VFHGGNVVRVRGIFIPGCANLLVKKAFSLDSQFAKNVKVCPARCLKNRPLQFLSPSRRECLPFTFGTSYFGQRALFSPGSGGCFVTCVYGLAINCFH